MTTASTTTTEKIKILRYDWLALYAVTKGDYEKIVDILYLVYGIDTNITCLRVAANYNNNEDRHKVNFVVEGIKLLRMFHANKVQKRFIGQFLELAAYRDLYDFNRTKDNRLEKIKVLDILEKMDDIHRNPLVKVDDKFIHFTCEHLR